MSRQWLSGRPRTKEVRVPGHASPVITQPCSVTPCVSLEVCRINIDPAFEIHVPDFQANRALSECSLKPSSKSRAVLQYTFIPARCTASRHTSCLQTSEIEPCGCRQLLPILESKGYVDMHALVTKPQCRGTPCLLGTTPWCRPRSRTVFLTAAQFSHAAHDCKFLSR